MIKNMAQVKEILHLFKQIRNTQSLYEKEYYFDENLGQSVQEHIEELKEKMPQLDVSVRRDKDGFAIIKTLWAPKFKYSLDEIEKYDPTAEQKKIKETLDTVLKISLDNGSEKAI